VDLSSKKLYPSDLKGSLKELINVFFLKLLIGFYLLNMKNREFSIASSNANSGGLPACALPLLDLQIKIISLPKLILREKPIAI